MDYNIGPSPKDTTLNLYNEQEYVTTPQWNVIGIINGTIPNEVVVVGNHRDAWIAGGAGDPNSGSAVLNEVIRSMGIALDAGWKPMRTIIFASWDGEEYGLLGSTEWVEEYLPWLSAANIAYVNVDVGVRGTKLKVAAAPLLNQIIRDVTQAVPSPNQTIPGQTVGDLWDGYIRNMGSGSDFTAFQDYAGVPSIDLGFDQEAGSPVYPYHSNYDSFHWMEKFGDPGFVYHRTMAQIIGLFTAELSESLVIPFAATEYADALSRYLDDVFQKLGPSTEPVTEEEIISLRSRVTPGEPKGSEDLLDHSLKNLQSSIVILRVKAAELDELARWANELLWTNIPWWNIITKIKLGRAVAKANTQFKAFERSFLYAPGLDGREWFKHVVFAPGLWTGYSGGKSTQSLDMTDVNRH